MSDYLDIGLLQTDDIDIGLLQSSTTSALTINQNENFNLLDSEIIVLNLLLTFSDQISLSDSVVIQTPGGPLVFSDSFSFTDSVTVVLNDLYTFSDQLMLTDASVDVVVVIIVINGDTLTLTDAIIATPFAVITLSLSESLTISDALSIFTSNPLSTNDQLVLQDSIQLSSMFVNDFSDTLSLTDNVQVVLIPIENTVVTDQFMLSDVVTVQLNSIFTPLTLSLSDSLALMDGVSIGAIPENIAFSDAFMLDDSIKLVVISYLNPYLRRYLNDVVGVGNP